MGKYDDIINLPHHVSSRHPHMSARDRAAQFSPFAALTGHGDAINETARLTEDRLELDAEAQAMLDEKLRALDARLDERPAALITYFLQDLYKEGGTYVTVLVHVKKIDRYGGVIVAEEAEIPVADIAGIEFK